MSKGTSVKSPIVEGAKAYKIKEISTDWLRRMYKSRYGMDVFTAGSEPNQISVYRCESTDYEFFHPHELAGGSSFYESLQDFDWYYMPWKWEHKECYNLLSVETKILEVGSGQGAFLKNLTKKNSKVHCTGLELNESAEKKGERFKVVNASIEEYAKSHQGEFDLVCSFQVLEHVPMVRSFIQSSVDCLKPGGRLVVCVPNNDSFISIDDENILNYPPHHMGLWGEKSLTSLAKHFGLTVDKVIKEPLQEYHFDWYQLLSLKKTYGTFLAKVIFRLQKMTGLNKGVVKNLSRNANQIAGHSILVTYIKK